MSRDRGESADSVDWLAAETCTEPVISPSYYTTSDAVISSETVFVVEISLTCKNGAQAQRNNEDVSDIKPLFTVSVDHRGAWSGPWVSTEVLAAFIGLLVYYMAFSAKSNIQA
ncbi:hypothetical protein JD844_010342 [Phrynosoma platyrhinos]|uniref:Translocon-associated protein subunit delta n=1 Tax=Phrynosoma platyrhinos TaxID=52577 RepID=A0ABQ7TGE4_PHRPL|nr:hypothetical protein JD844_010342 [Phrynosoma platyrhinos]